MDSPSGAIGVGDSAFGEVVAWFAAEHARLADPMQAREVCVETSEAFVQACLNAGIPAKTVTGAKFGETSEFPGVRLLMHGHTAALVADGEIDRVYDWTARQFDATAPFPAIMTREQWHEEWAHPDSW